MVNKSSDSLTPDVIADIDHHGVASVTLCRPDKANAFNAEVIAQLIALLDSLSANPQVRCLILSGQGKHFSAGADLNWMRSMVDKSEQENQLDAYQLATLLDKLDHFPTPTIALVQGCAFGGALGLICCCDMVFASEDCQLCLSEVKLGLVPATIAPYVIRAMGVRNARRYMLSAERIDAQAALQLNLIHQISAPQSLQHDATHWLQPLLKHGPQAMVEAKKLCHHCSNIVIDQELMRYTSQLIARIRVSDQGQEGLSAFLQRRSPKWDEKES